MRRSILKKYHLLLSVVVALGFAASAEAVSVLDVPPVYYPATSDYTNETYHAFQGIPGLEKTAGGRLWATWYSGGTTEGAENYVTLATSGDDGNSWTDVIMAIDPLDSIRAFDPCLWTAPDGRLWFFWAQAETHHVDAATWAIVTEDPDSEMPTWSSPTRLCDGIMMNKPTVLDNGNWLLPTAIWNTEGSCRVVQTADNGQTFDLIGQANVPSGDRNCDEPMIVERDNDLWMLVRTDYGIGQSVSSDGGYTWSEVSPTSITATVSRFFVRELDSGNYLLVTHSPDADGSRSLLTAYLSPNQGASWTGGLLIDERSGVSYPDGVQDDDGTIYITYDRNRTTDREILMATFTEADVLAGEAVSEDARFRVLINKANVYPSVEYDPVFEPIVDRTGNGYDAVLHDYVSSSKGMTVVPADVGGLTEAFAFDHAHIAAPKGTDSPNLGDAVTEGTISAWVKFNPGYSDGMSSWNNVVFTGASWDDGTFRIEMAGETNLRAVARPDGSDRSDIAVGFESPEANQWYHVAYSFGLETEDENLSKTMLVITDSQGNAFTYFGAEYDATATFDLTDLCFGGMNMFDGADRDSYLDGQMTDLRVYAEALSAAEIALLADSDFATNPVAILLAQYYPISKIPGDANNDGVVDGSDVTILAGNWQKGVSDGQTASWADGDFNGDGQVDGSDVTILAGNWQYGVDAATASVPEPSTVAMLAIILLGLAWRFKRTTNC